MWFRALEVLDVLHLSIVLACRLVQFDTDPNTLGKFCATMISNGAITLFVPYSIPNFDLRHD
eukprot:m.143469 g.143469  ORF g.143469 m.143469 type:complete len:62 (-) comp17698_c0_seq1:371-556(-)